MSIWRDKLKKESEIVYLIREYFKENGFIETLTPHLYKYPNLDGHINNFITFFDYENKKKVMYLTTSPEYFMKELLSKGVYPIYQITSAFRNGELDNWHIPEFLILEWYEEGNSMDVLINRLIDMLKYIYGEEFEYSGKTVSTDDIGIYSSVDILEDRGIDIDRIDDYEYMKNVCIKHNIFYDRNYNVDDLYWAIFYEFIEKNMQEGIVFVKYFPYFTGGMAKMSFDYPKFTERVECYISKVEIGNGYVESMNSGDMMKRFEEYAKKYNLRYKVPKRFLESIDKIDKDFVGMAIGVHRLPYININIWKEMMDL